MTLEYVYVSVSYYFHEKYMTDSDICARLGQVLEYAFYRTFDPAIISF